MKKRSVFKSLLPLVISFFGAVIFFLGYNHYLLDKSLVNLKISLRQIKTPEALAEIDSIKDILDDTFLVDISQDDFNLASAVKLEMSAQVIEDLPEDEAVGAGEDTKKIRLVTEVDLASNIVGGATRMSQLKDAEFFIENVINEKTKNKTWIALKLENWAAAIFPGKRREDERNTLAIIKNIINEAASDKGEALQGKYLKVARLYLRIKDLDGAVVYLDKISKIDSKNSYGLRAQFYLGIVHKLKGQFQEAREVFSEIKGDLSGEWNNFVTYQEADSLASLGKKEEAAVLLEQVFDKDSTSPVAELAQFRAGRMYLYDLNNPSKAREVFDKLKEETSGELSGFVDYKIMTDVEARYQQEGYKLLNLAYQALDIDKYKEAIKKFDLSLSMNEKNALSHIGKGLTFVLLDQHEEAVEAAKKAEALNPESADVLAITGFIYYALGKIDLAIDKYEKAIRINDTAVGPDILYYNLGTLYVINEDYSKAARALKKALEINEDFAYANNNLGYVMWTGKKYSEAKEYIRKAIALKSDYADAQYNLGVLFYSIGDYEEARKQFLRSDRGKPGYKKTEQYLNKIKGRLGY